MHQAMAVTSLARELYELIDAKLDDLHGSNEVPTAVKAGRQPPGRRRSR